MWYLHRILEKREVVFVSLKQHLRRIMLVQHQYAGCKQRLSKRARTQRTLLKQLTSRHPHPRTVHTSIVVWIFNAEPTKTLEAGRRVGVWVGRGVGGDIAAAAAAAVTQQFNPFNKSYMTNEGNLPPSISVLCAGFYGLILFTSPFSCSLSRSPFISLYF